MDAEIFKMELDEVKVKNLNLTAQVEGLMEVLKTILQRKVRDCLCAFGSGSKTGNCHYCIIEKALTSNKEYLQKELAKVVRDIGIFKKLNQPVKNCLFCWAYISNTAQDGVRISDHVKSCELSARIKELEDKRDVLIKHIGEVE